MSPPFNICERIDIILVARPQPRSVPICTRQSDAEKLEEDLQRFEDDFGVALMVAPPGEKEGEESESEESDFNEVDPSVPAPNM